MNLFHQWLCGSSLWRRYLEARVMPWALQGFELPVRVLEVGPGPGMSTQVLLQRGRRVTAVEADNAAAAALARRLATDSLQMVCGDGAALPLPDASFAAALCFHMLHHMPAPEHQDRLLREVRRVLQPGGFFAGVDNRKFPGFALVHWRDTMTPVDPGGLVSRLEVAGFVDVRVESGATAFRFFARRA